MPKVSLEKLKKRSEFLAAAKTDLRWVAPAFLLQVYQRSSINLSRYGITASRKVGGAVERNRAKRRLRALIHQILPLYAQPGIDYVLIARKEILTRNFALMAQELEKALKILQK